MIVGPLTENGGEVAFEMLILYTLAKFKELVGDICGDVIPVIGSMRDGD